MPTDAAVAGIPSGGAAAVPYPPNSSNGVGGR